MRGVNSLFLLGTLPGEPEQITSKAGKKYIRFELDLVTIRRSVQLISNAWKGGRHGRTD